MKHLNQDKLVATIEDGTLNGGLYTVVNRVLNENKLNNQCLGFGFDDVFVPQGSVDELQNLCGLDKDAIYNKIKEIL